MTKKQVELCVYGAEVICPSCVGMPSSKETFEWLKAAISRKFPNQPFNIAYVDIFDPPSTDQEKTNFAAKVIEEDLFYPVVVLEGKIVGEGNPKLKIIYEELENYGYEREGATS